MDPISIGVVILAIYGMLQRSPQWAGEMAEEWRAARRGEVSPAAAARRQRLIDAGVDPASGGPMRQYLGNRWRDYWLDQDEKATRRRADRQAREAAGEVLSWRERMAARADDEVSRRAEQFRSRPPSDTVPPVSVGDDGPKAPPSAPGGPEGDNPVAPPAGDPDGTGSTGDAPTVDSTDKTTATGPGAAARDTGEPDDAGAFGDQPHSPPTDTPHQETDTGREPIRVTATVGEPERNNSTMQPDIAAIAAITAGGTMTAVAQQAVTGVVSGAAEARAIQAAMDHATDEYVAQLNRLRNRIMSLGEQTLSTVQMSGKSHVINNTAASAEAAAAAIANARACTAEVTPLLGEVARAFDRINS